MAHPPPIQSTVIDTAQHKLKVLQNIEALAVLGICMIAVCVIMSTQMGWWLFAWYMAILALSLVCMLALFLRYERRSIIAEMTFPEIAALPTSLLSRVPEIISPVTGRSKIVVARIYHAEGCPELTPGAFTRTSKSQVLEYVTGKPFVPGYVSIDAAFDAIVAKSSASLHSVLIEIFVEQTLMRTGRS